MQLPGKLGSSSGAQAALPQMGKLSADWEVGAHYIPAGTRKQRPKVRDQG